jgi:hypothetical protein
VPILLIGIAGITLGRDPNGLIPAITTRLSALGRRRRRPAASDAEADRAARPREAPTLSAPVEALGLLVPFTPADIDALDRELSLPRSSRGA